MYGQHVLCRLPPGGEGQVLHSQVLRQVLLQVVYAGRATAEPGPSPRPAAASQETPNAPHVVTYPQARVPSIRTDYVSFDSNGSPLRVQELLSAHYVAYING